MRMRCTMRSAGALRIKQLQQEKRELLESLELYYRVFVLGEEIPEEEGENANSSAGAPENMEDTDGESRRMKNLKIGNVTADCPVGARRRWRV